MKNKVLIIIFLLFLGVTAVSGAYLTINNEQLTINKPNADEYPTLSPSPKNEGTNEEINNRAERDSSVVSLPQNDSVTQSNNNTATDTKYLIQNTKYLVTLAINTTAYPLSVLPSTTVYEAMQLLQIDSRQPFQFSAKEYPSMGYFVEEINGVKNDTRSNTYWIMYVNGQSATVGASAYILKAGDRIEWKFEKAKF
ncbi:MAG: DUF4430 domain-containing protein [Candidatus Magasanikbacteria bacterium]